MVLDKSKVETVNKIISSHASLILGRIGRPCKEKNISVIVLLVEGDNDQLGAFSGKLGALDGIKTRVSVF